MDGGATPPRREDVEELLSLYRKGDLARAVEHGASLALRYPDAALVHNIVGAAHAGLKRFEPAIACYRRALAIAPETAEFHNNLGVALRGLGDSDGAIDSYRRALAINPDHASGHVNLGNALRGVARGEEALASYRRAVAARPDFADAHYYLGNMLVETGRRAEAIASYGRALAIDPGHADARAHRLHQQAHICDWDAMRGDTTAIPGLGITGPSVSPFTMLSLDDHPERQRIRAERYTADRFGRDERADIAAPAIRPASRPERLRIGYFSADFHDHATMHLMAGLFDHHDRSRFDIHIFSYGPDRDDGMRRRLCEAVDRFHDVRTLGDGEIAALARAEAIGVAVDLKGLTGDARLGIFAGRAAPVQLSYLGYPGTLGASFIDYIIADKVVIPERQRAQYTEKILYLPHSYQANDNRRTITDRAMSRAEMGLPDEGFVFCCFNSNYKIGPDVFEIWMNLLKSVENSVLWLFRENPWAEENLRAHARRAGISPDRLIFAGRVPQAEHLARHRLADLFLDTFACNAHTTASDALWTGLPVVTRMGDGFAARVAASLLHALGLPDLVTTNSRDYEALALHLATDRRKLGDIARRLLNNLQEYPLFRPALLAGHLESAYDRTYQRYLAGAEPADLLIS